MKNKKILLAGGTGYLGGFLAQELQRRSYFTRAIARDPARLQQGTMPVNEAVVAEVTQPASLKGCCDSMDVVISCIGITRQRDGLRYMDVDFQANLNLLQEAKQSGVRKFIYVSVLHGERLRHLKICEAKERFVAALQQSGLEYTIIRPNGFFSDMTEYFNMARKGRVYLFGEGSCLANPIHGEDLAELCVAAIDKDDREIEAGGPETLSHNEIARAAFAVLGKEPKITHIPDWVRVAVLTVLRVLTGSKVYGPMEFFLTVMAMDMIAPQCGKQRLADYFHSLCTGDS